MIDSNTPSNPDTVAIVVVQKEHPPTKKLENSS